MKKVYLFLVMMSFILFFTSYSARAKENKTSLNFTLPKELTLKKVQEIALSRNPDINQLLARIESARARAWQIYSTYFPRISASFSRTHYGETNNAALGPTGRGAYAIDDLYSVGISADWLVFDGLAREFRAKKASLSKQSSRAAYLEGVRLLYLGLAQSFYRILLTQEEIAINEADMAFQKRNLYEAKQKQAAGTASRSDVLNFMTRYNTAKSNVYQSRLEYEAALSILAALISLPEAKIPPETTFQKPQVETLLSTPIIDDASLIAKEYCLSATPEFEPLFALALAHRPDLEQRELAIKIAQATVKENWSSFFPKVILSGDYSGLSYEDSHFQSEDFSSSVSIGLNWDLFSGGSRLAGIKEAQSDKQAEEYAMQKQIDNISSELRQVLIQHTYLRRQLRLRKINAKNAEELRDYVEKEYKAGLQSLARLNQAQSEQVTAAAVYAQTLYQLAQVQEQIRSIVSYYTIPLE